MESIKELRAICQKKISKEDSITMRYFVRKFSIYITKLFLLLGSGPTFVSILVLLTTIASGILFMFADYKYNLIAVVLLQVSYILDAVDGEIARYKEVDSINGKYLDCVFNYVGFPIVIFGLSFGVYKYFNNTLILIAGFIASLFFLLVDVVRITRFEVIFELVRKSIKVGTKFKKLKEGDITSLKRYNSLTKKTFYYFSILFNFRGFSYILLIAAIFNWIYVYLFLILFYAFILPIIVFGRIYYEYKKGLERFLPYFNYKQNKED